MKQTNTTLEGVFCGVSDPGDYCQSRNSFSKFDMKSITGRLRTKSLISMTFILIFFTFWTKTRFYKAYSFKGARRTWIVT